MKPQGARWAGKGVQGAGPDAQQDLFTYRPELELAEATGAIRDVMAWIARTWEALPHGWAKRGVSQRLRKDRILQKVETKVTEQYNRLLGRDVSPDDAEDALNKILQGVEIYRARAAKILDGEVRG